MMTEWSALSTLYFPRHTQQHDNQWCMNTYTNTELQIKLWDMHLNSYNMH